MQETTTCFIEVPDDLYRKLFTYLANHRSLNLDSIAITAISRYLELEEARSVEVPADLLSDLSQVCLWVPYVASVIGPTLEQINFLVDRTEEIRSRLQEFTSVRSEVRE